MASEQENIINQKTLTQAEILREKRRMKLLAR